MGVQVSIRRHLQSCSMKRTPESYLNFLAPNDIRIKDHRHGIEHVLLLYRDGLSVEQLLRRYETLTAEEVEAVIAYYHQNRAAVDAYLDAAEEHAARMRREQDENPHPGVVRLRELKRARQKQPVAE